MFDMNSREVTVRVPTSASVQDAWAAMTDWSRQRDWMLGTRVYVVAGDGHSVGSRLLGFTGLLDIGFADLLEITEWEPPRRCRVRHAGKLLRGWAEFAVEPGASIRWTECLESPLSLASPLLKVGMLASLRRLAASLR
jgi:polyketide cyclase/dehydrase/lipid transport protein